MKKKEEIEGKYEKGELGGRRCGSRSLSEWQAMWKREQSARAYGHLTSFRQIKNECKANVQLFNVAERVEKNVASYVLLYERRIMLIHPRLSVQWIVDIISVTQQRDIMISFAK